MAGVTWVSCLPSHRRRGILTQMMRHQLDDIASRGEPLAGLGASEAVIYNRFGYGLASQFVSAKVRKARAQLRSASSAGGRMRMVWEDERPKVLAPIFDSWRRERPGAVHRSDGRWEVLLRDREYERHDASTWFFAVHEDDTGRPDGYVGYRIRGDPEDYRTVLVEELVAIDPEVEAKLWEFVFGVDLTDTVDVRVDPVDSQLPWRLVDQRAYECTGVHDHLWIRVVDTPAALSARRYQVDGALVIEVVDGFRPDGAAAGRFRLTGGPDGATCVVEKSADVEITVPIAALGSAYLGSVKWTTLATAGRVTGSPDALRRADAMFATTPAPFCNTDF
jgi:predicted acetyltransferase